MPSTHDNEAFKYAERIRERLQELREAAGLSMYALWLKCGVSRDMISRVEGGESIPTLHVAARLADGGDAEPHPSRFLRAASRGAAVGG